MSSAQRFLHADTAGGYTPPSLVPRPMDFFSLWKRFWQLDSQQNFGSSATRLYMFLLEEFNRDFFPEQLTLADSRLSLALGTTANTLKKAREELVERAGLRYRGGQNGRGHATVYRLTLAGGKVSKNDTYSTDNRAEKVSDKVSENDTYSPIKVSAKVSKNDTLLYKEKHKLSKTEDEVHEASSSSAQIEEIITPQPARQKAEPQTEGSGRRPGAFDEPAECTSADESPLSKPDIFRAICLDEGYPQIDFEHYRLSILNASRDEGLVLPARKWRARIRRWLENAKQAQKLILAAVPGQTKGDPRAVQPLAARSSASPTRKQSWS